MSIDHLRSKALSIVESMDTPGLAVSVYRNGKVIHEDAYGYSKLVPEKKVTTDTAFMIYSLTKVFTATAVIQLYERGIIDIDRPVSTYLPGMKLTNSYKTQVTTRHLLAHASGLKNPMPISWVHLEHQKGRDLKKMVTDLLEENGELRFEPGSKSSYSNLGYLILGVLIEQMSGVSFEQYIQQNILEPLGMYRSGFAYGKDKRDVAYGYIKRFSFFNFLGWFVLDDGFFSPVRKNGFKEFNLFYVDGAPYGGIIGSVSDLMHFLIAHLNGGIYNGARILSKESVEEMRGNTRRSKGLVLGWRLDSSGGIPFYGHTGGGGGFRSEIRIYPSIHYAIAVLSNATGFGTDAITDIVYKVDDE